MGWIQKYDYINLTFGNLHEDKFKLREFYVMQHQ